MPGTKRVLGRHLVGGHPLMMPRLARWPCHRLPPSAHTPCLARQKSCLLLCATGWHCTPGGPSGVGVGGTP